MKAHFAVGAFILLTGSAFAADLPDRDQPPAPASLAPSMLAPKPAAQWSGLYVGGAAGYLALQTENPKIRGFEIGARAGYDQQFGAIVAGVSLDGDATFAEGDVANYKAKAPFKLGASARLGYEIAPNTLAYGLGGFTFLDVKVKTTAANPPGSAMGFALGVGMEQKLAANWSVFGEYRFHRLWADNDRVFNALEAKVGVNYRFGGDNRAIFARY
jgi:opacity protein-like surface antigen